ncbi:MAG: VOC family protein [Chitinispirillaceae bacterium]|nr:VOC family protein [Chitinispirillaceae bacterium]
MENSMQKIVPNLWYNGNAKEAVDFYVSVFPDAKVIATSYYPKSKEEGLADFQLNMAGRVLSIDFEIMWFRFVAINAGPEFTPNPSISFFITLDSKEEIDALWGKLSGGGNPLMTPGKYPFSEYYGWVQDKYNVSWQLILNNPTGDWRPKVIPSLLFTQDKNGKAEAAVTFYTFVFKNAKNGLLVRRTEDDPVAKAGTLMFGDFAIENTWIAAIDGGQGHEFTFNEGVSLLIACKGQDEIDYYWEKLTEDGGEESICGWLKDKYGVSWQVAPANMEELMKKPDAFKIMMQQKKIIIAEY